VKRSTRCTAKAATFATAKLTHGPVDHVPALFGLKKSSEVADNHAGAGKSFKETMHHLKDGARKVVDAHLHMPIRKSETLPSGQQVNFSAQLDVLLSEIVRMTWRRTATHCGQRIVAGCEGL
jgi:hypothetical protein